MQYEGGFDNFAGRSEFRMGSITYFSSYLLDYKGIRSRFGLLLRSL
jgi:hypothetical protein